MEKTNKIIFMDFDGTITKQDTCEAMVIKFARDGWEEINKLWEQKKLSTKDCANETFKLFDATIDDIKALLDTIEIDEYFKEFVALCNHKGYRIYVLSDGYDLNIETIFKKFNIDLPYYTNKILYDNGFKIDCPNEDENCHDCGTCKKGLMNKIKHEDEQVIYIGDGFSDTCPAKAADIVFAKKSLLKYCRQNGIPAHEYLSFKDIIESGLV